MSFREKTKKNNNKKNKEKTKQKTHSCEGIAVCDSQYATIEVDFSTDVQVMEGIVTASTGNWDAVTLQESALRNGTVVLLWL